MWDKVLQLLAVSCRHRHVSQPFSAVSRDTRASALNDWDSVSPGASGHYVVCLDCGKHFTYDWSRMCVVK